MEVTDVSNKGDGISRVQGFVVFVKKGKVGQKPKVKIDKVENTFAISRIVIKLCVLLSTDTVN